MVLLWLKFIIAALIIIFSGVRLCHYGDQIAQKTGLTRAWIGIILIAAITSLPELVTSMGAALMIGAPNLALGDLLGSNAFNLMALGLLLILYHSSRPLPKIGGGIICALCGILLVGLVGTGIILHSPFSLGWVGLDSLLILIVYILGMKLVYRYEHRNQKSDIRNQKSEKELPITKFVIVALFITGASIWLANLGEEIALKTLWGRTFVGSFFLAIATSFPEVVVAGAALRLGALDMAVGNLLGSNMFNLAIISLVDIFYRPGPILRQVSSPNLLTVGVIITLTLVALGGLLYRSQKRIPRFSFDGLFIILIYLAGLYYLFGLSKK